MRSHPFLRAYMAGVLLPTWVLLIVLGVVLATHFLGHVPARVDLAIVFPMAVVPNLWGLWNLLYIGLGLRERVPIGAFGALLPLVLVPAGVALAGLLDLGFYGVRQAAVALPIAMALYFLAWKFVVAFFNRIVDLR